MKWKKYTRAPVGNPMAKELAARMRAETDLYYFDTRHAQAFLDLLADEMAQRIQTRKEVTIPSIGTLHARATREHLVKNRPTRRIYTTLRLTAKLREKMHEAVTKRDPDREWQRRPVSPPSTGTSRSADNGDAPARHGDEGQ